MVKLYLQIPSSLDDTHKSRSARFFSQDDTHKSSVAFQDDTHKSSAPFIYSGCLNFTGKKVRSLVWAALQDQVMSASHAGRKQIEGNFAQGSFLRNSLD